MLYHNMRGKYRYNTLFLLFLVAFLTSCQMPIDEKATVSIINISSKSESDDFKVDSYQFCDFYDDVAVFQKTEGYSGEIRYGYLEKSGKILLEPKYVEVYPFINGIGRFVDEDGKYWLIDKDGQISKRSYDKISEFQDGIARIELNNRVGYIDVKESLLGGNFFEYGRSFSDGMACIRENNKFGYINGNGMTVIVPQFSDAEDFRNGIAIIREKRDGVSDEAFESIDLYPVGTHDWGAINKRGEWIIPLTYDYLWNLGDGRIYLEKNGLFGISDLDGNISVPLEYSHIKEYSDGLSMAVKDGKCGYLNLKGEYAIQPQYMWGENFQGGVAIAYPEYYMGYSDTGELFVLFKYVVIDQCGEIIYRPDVWFIDSNYVDYNSPTGIEKLRLKNGYPIIDDSKQKKEMLSLVGIQLIDFFGEPTVNPNFPYEQSIQVIRLNENMSISHKQI